jgi:hypothetical protein
MQSVIYGVCHYAECRSAHLNNLVDPSLNIFILKIRRRMGVERSEEDEKKK